MTSARERYRNDPVFHRLVDMLRAILHGNQATPSELREALMLAVYCEEMENPSPVLARIDSLRKILEDDHGARLVDLAREMRACPVHGEAPAPRQDCAGCTAAFHAKRRDASFNLPPGEEAPRGR